MIASTWLRVGRVLSLKMLLNEAGDIFNAWAKHGIKLACGECMIQMNCEEEEDENEENSGNF